MGQMVTVTECAALTGISKSQVSRQTREWHLIGPDRRFDLDAYKARRAVELNPLMQRGPEPADAGLPALSAPGGGPGGKSTSSAVADLKELQAELLRRKLAEQDAEQMPVQQAVQLATRVAGVARAQWLGLPARVAVELAGESDPDRIETILNARVNEMLAEFSAALRQAADGGDGAEAS